eukprot:CAMPEP_0113672982 /NCGR_PEP_ID=MMETSP0038_2-20120614/6594_1 /TAXON_ID=2898 /ORGANISM="Cryptomonas paramecium" /LENGTH=144 /DNA_ID=CAMNT_0000589369 /DNA_START=243 /DNA_END=674 /DNA_ORIENTATION=+ /assembly_acc=CAM_ASM_000170
MLYLKGFSHLSEQLDSTNEKFDSLQQEKAVLEEDRDHLRKELEDNRRKFAAENDALRKELAAARAEAEAARREGGELEMRMAQFRDVLEEREHALELQLEQLHLALQSSASNWLDKDQQLTRLLTSPPEGGGSASRVHLRKLAA